jgi:hypothetical protein
MAGQRPAVAQTYKPAAPPTVTAPPVKVAAPPVKVAAPSAKVAAPSAKVAAPSVKGPTPAVARYPQISNELRRIGMLAGIILVTLVVLALVLH